jgi:hypothetical protein
VAARKSRFSPGRLGEIGVVLCYQSLFDSETYIIQRKTGLAAADPVLLLIGRGLM